MHTRASLFSEFPTPLKPGMNKILFPLAQSSQVHTFLAVHSNTHQLSRHPRTHVFPPPKYSKKRDYFFPGPYLKYQVFTNTEASLPWEGKKESAATNSALGVCFLEPVIMQITAWAPRPVKMRNVLNTLCSPTDTSRHNANDMTTQRL